MKMYLEGNIFSSYIQYHTLMGDNPSNRTLNEGITIIILESMAQIVTEIKIMMRVKELVKAMIFTIK